MKRTVYKSFVPFLFKMEIFSAVLYFEKNVLFGLIYFFKMLVSTKVGNAYEKKETGKYK